MDVACGSVCVCLRTRGIPGVVRVENPLCGTFSQREREKVVFGGGRSTTTVFRILGDCRAEAGARGVAVNESGQQRQKAAIFPAQEEKPCK